MIQRRKYKRDSVFLSVLVEVLNKDRECVINVVFHGITYDLNKYGVCLEIRDFDSNLVDSINLEDKYIFNLKIYIPNYGYDLEILVRPVWCSEEVKFGVPIFRVGATFVDPEEKDVLSLCKYIKKVNSFRISAFISVFSFFILFLLFFFENYFNKLFAQYYFNRLNFLKKESEKLNNDFLYLNKKYISLSLELEKAREKILSLQEELKIKFDFSVEREIKKLNIKKYKIEKQIKKVEKKTETIKIRKKENNDVTIFLSQTETDILYNWLKKTQVFKTGLVGSYEGSRELSGIAFTYDEALCVDVFLAKGDLIRAKNILDFFINKALKLETGYFFFNAYSKNSGNVLEWMSHVGPNVWLGMAILHYVEKSNDRTYLDFAKNIADYVIDLQDNYGGIKGGDSVNWYSTEHNLDSYAFFRMFYKMTKENRYKYSADLVLRWLFNDVYIKNENRFMRGKNDRVVATDTVSFGIPAIGPKILYQNGIDPEKLIKFIENKTKNVTLFKNDKNEVYNIEGFDYTDYKVLNRESVVSSEWTAQMVTAYKVMADYFKMRDEQKYKYYMDKVSFYLGELSKMIIKSENGSDVCGLPYATRAMVDTGHGWFTPKDDNVISIAGTAYNLLARMFINPFMLDSEKDDYYGA